MTADEDVSAEQQPPDYPVAWEFDALLADGSPVHVRPIRPADAAELVSFHTGLSFESVYRRFFGAHPWLSPTEVERFTVVDYKDRFALVAIMDDELVAVARFDRIADPEVAEVAFVVADRLQGRGIGTLMLEHLAGAARDRGITRFEADTLLENKAMLGVFRDAGFELSSSMDQGVVHVEFGIAPNEASTLAADERERRAAVLSVRRLLFPSSVAVIGASNRTGTIGHGLFGNIVAGGFRGDLYPVNPSSAEVLGLESYADIASLPRPADLAVVVVPARSVLAVVEACGNAGVRSLVVISAGFAEVGAEGARLQSQLLEAVRRHGMRMVGPNCMGIVNTGPDACLNATFAPVAPTLGPIGFMSQSGAMGIVVLERAAELGLGVTSFVSVGNKADISGNDLLCYWEADPGTSLVLLYLESFGNPRKFARIARRVSRTKPIVALKAGRTSAGARAASSHTAAAASPEVATDALFRQAGVIRVPTMAEMFDVSLVLANQPMPTGSRIAIVGNSGGPGILAADACEDAELVLADLATETTTALQGFLPAEASLANPVDMIAGATPAQYEQAIDTVLSDPGVDMVLVIFTPPLVTQAADVTAAIIASAGRHPEKPVVATLLTEGSRPGTVGGGGGRRAVPTFAFPEQAVGALGRIAHYGRWLTRPAGVVPSLPGVDLERARATALEELGAGEGRWIDSAAIGRLLGSVGIEMVPSRPVDDVDAAASAARELGFPVALKAGSPAIVHKTDVGAVAVDLDSEDAVRSAFTVMSQRLGESMGGAVVQAMAEPGVEILVGVTQDPAFGPLVAFGLGGVTTEVLGDTAFRIVPVTDVDAAELVRSLKGSALLLGYRGSPPADVAALEDLVLRVGMLADGVPELADLDLNPVIASPSGVAVVDAKVRLQSAVDGPGPLARALRRSTVGR